MFPHRACVRLAQGRATAVSIRLTTTPPRGGFSFRNPTTSLPPAGVHYETLKKGRPEADGSRIAR